VVFPRSQENTQDACLELLLSTSVPRNLAELRPKGNEVVWQLTRDKAERHSSKTLCAKGQNKGDPVAKLLRCPLLHRKICTNITKLINNNNNDRRQQLKLKLKLQLQRQEIQLQLLHLESVHLCATPWPSTLYPAMDNVLWTPQFMSHLAACVGPKAMPGIYWVKFSRWRH